MHMQFKFEIFHKIQRNKKKLTKYSKKSQNCPKFEHKVLNNVGRPHKKIGQKKPKFFFYRVPALALGKEGIFTECRALALGKGPLCRVPRPALGKDFFKKKFDSVGGLGRQVPFFLPSATLCRVLHSTKRAFAECRPLPSAGHSVALGKATLCRVLDFAECHPVRHSAKSGFAECPIFGTRQSWRHSANLRSPVVNSHTP